MKCKFFLSIPDPRTKAQKVLGNKWTEIVKVVSGRTDNAVKNRFSTLCKRRAKDEELYQENGVPCSNSNAKRVLTETEGLTPGGVASLLHIKQMRSITKLEEGIGFLIAGALNT
ncbi:transcription factor MYB88-like [Miscanthus floridulus]|uniref:transcription factor MYB88-like n=1 Tax=Miscanthus floridulus TaxID=154761 RepID=UPI003459A35C